jgi:hypothetical protein
MKTSWVKKKNEIILTDENDDKDRDAGVREVWHELEDPSE